MPKTDKSRLTLWIDQPIHDWLYQECRRKQMTMSEVVRDYIELLYRLHEENGNYSE